MGVLARRLAIRCSIVNFSAVQTLALALGVSLRLVEVEGACKASLYCLSTRIQLPAGHIETRHEKW